MVAPSTPNPPQYSKGLSKCFYCGLTMKNELLHDYINPGKGTVRGCSDINYCEKTRHWNKVQRDMDHGEAIPLYEEWKAMRIKERMSEAEQIARLKGIPFVRGGG